MKKLVIFMLLLCLFAAALSSCGDGDNGENGGIMDNGSYEEFQLKAVVKGVGEFFEVEVIESDYAFGIYHVRTSELTKYFDSAGNEISRADISGGDKIYIVYGGQVMMSYPPQIVAKKISLAN